MNFSRDQTGARACLEFSWVMTGMRGKIILAPGVASGKDTFATSQPASLQGVQAYRLAVGGLGDHLWMFPPTKQPSQIATAAIRVVENTTPAQVYGVILYTDGSMYNATIPVKDDPPLPCPEP
jgi:hypothetical protein